MGDPIQFVIYERVYCHLCHDMQKELFAMLGKIADGPTFSIETVDVDECEMLEQRFGERVPVLMAGGRELCHYFLDPVAVRAYLAEIR